LESEWDALKKGAKQLERDIKILLRDFGRRIREGGANSTSSTANESESAASDLSQQYTHLEARLQELSRAVEKMHACVQQLTASENYATMFLLMTRYRDTHRDYQRQLLQHKHRWAAQRRTRLPMPESTRRSPEADAEAARLLNEQQHIDRSLSMTDQLIRQAGEVRLELGDQRSVLERSNQRTNGSAQALPGINGVIRQINTRKGRERLVLASVISTSSFFLMWYLFG